jgi:hypothetical protein
MSRVQGRQHAKKSRDDSDDGSEGQVCEGDACGQGHSLGSGAGGRARDPVSALPGLVFEPRVAKSVVSFMLADSPDKVRHQPGTCTATISPYLHAPMMMPLQKSVGL